MTRASGSPTARLPILEPFPPLQRAILLERENRFVARVRLGRRTLRAVLSNTGRLVVLMQPGREVFLRQALNPQRKHAQDLVLVRAANRRLVCVDTAMPNRVVARALRAGRMPELGRFDELYREVTRAHSRFDLRLDTDGQPPLWVEIKSATLALGRESRFPDAPTARGRKHVLELAEAVRAGERGALVICAQRADVDLWGPHWAVDPEFGEAVQQAHAAGVQVLAYRCRVSTRGVSLGRRLPIDLERR